MQERRIGEITSDGRAGDAATADGDADVRKNLALVGCIRDVSEVELAHGQRTRERALEKPQDTPRVHVLHWPGGLKPDHPSVWDAEAGRPKDPIHWNDDPPSKYMFHGPMHPTHNRALRQWHHNYKHALKMLELPTVSQRKEKAGTVGVATLAHGGGLRARLFSFLG